MSRNPLPLGPGQAFIEPAEVGDPPPAKPYPLKRARRAAVPDRTREPVIGPACGDTRSMFEGDATDPTPRFTAELHEGVEMGTTRGNNEAVPKTTQEFGDARREARGVRTRPVRPGRAK